MKKIFCFLFLIIGLFSFAQENEFVLNQLILKFKNPLPEQAKTSILNQEFLIEQIDVLNRGYNVSKIKQTGNKQYNDTFVLFFSEKIDIDAAIKSYLATGMFIYVEPNYIGKSHGVQGISLTPNDTWTYPWQWSLNNDGTFPDATATPGADISMYNAWDIQQGSSTVIVAILDSGANINHPEFAGRIWENPGEVADGTDSDGNGYIDDLNGWDFAYDSNNLNDVLGHGTNVSGIIGEQGNNNMGYAGVDWNCKLMNIKVLEDNGYGLYTWWADGIYYAIDNGARVINMSLGGSGPSNLLEDAINFAYNNNVTVVVSNGNQNSVIQYPARYLNSIAVGATNPEDNRANPFHWGGGSNFGPEIDIVAPGDRVYGLHPTSNTDYSWFWSGTSQAAPHVSGVVSLLLAENPALTPAQIRTILRNSADDQVGLPSEDTPGFDIYYGYGRLNAENALNQAFLNINGVNASYFTLYPNPVTTGKLTITANQNGNATITITTILGKQLYREKTIFTGRYFTIDVSDLPSGVYFATVSSNGNIETKKFLKL